MKKVYKVDVTGVVAFVSLLAAGCVLAGLGQATLAELVIGGALGGAVIPSAIRAHHEEPPEGDA